MYIRLSLCLVWHSKDLRDGRFFCRGGLYDDPNLLIEGDEEAQKALNGELAESPRSIRETS